MTGDATDGAPILHLAAPGVKTKGSIFSRQIALARQRLNEEVALFTTPGRVDRLVQFIYTQLPYHPERIEAGTLWTAELASARQPGETQHQPVES